MPQPTDALAGLHAARLRTCAVVLRAVGPDALAAVEGIVPFDRDDVWQGAVADRFGEELVLRRRQVAMFAEQAALVAAQLEARADALFG